MAFGDALRIIFWLEDSAGSKLVAKDVIDRGDRFITVPDGSAYKKQYLNYTTATPEKEKMIENLYKKEAELDKFKMITLAVIFDKATKGKLPKTIEVDELQELLAAKLAYSDFIKSDSTNSIESIALARARSSVLTEIIDKINILVNR